MNRKKTEHEEVEKIREELQKKEQQIEDLSRRLKRFHHEVTLKDEELFRLRKKTETERKELEEKKGIFRNKN